MNEMILAIFTQIVVQLQQTYIILHYRQLSFPLFSWKEGICREYVYNKLASSQVETLLLSFSLSLFHIEMTTILLSSPYSHN